MTDIVKINPAEYGLEETKATEISNMFKPMLDKMVELESEFNEVVKQEVSESACETAKELRLRYVKVRTGTAKIHKDLKQFYLQGGRFVDGWKNAQLMASQGIEEKLMDIEKHYENIENEKIAKLQESRSLELAKFEVDFVPENLGEMQENVWGNYISGVKMNYDAQKEAERKAEEDRIKKEKAAIAEQKRIKKENERLKKEAEEKEKLRLAEEKKRKAKEEKERKEREEKERIREERLEKERAETKAKQDAERKKADAKLKAEREERERIQSELKAKQDAEAEAERLRLANIQAELNKGDHDKIADLIADLESLKTKYEFKSEKNRNRFAIVCVKLDELIGELK